MSGLTVEQSDPRCVCGHSIQSHSWSGCNAYVRPSVGGAGACCTRTPADIVAALIAEAAKRARADAWDECVDRICSANESGTANNARFKRANPYREARS